METLQKTRQGRRARLNVVSMVAFDGALQSADVTNANLDTGVQAISFIAQINSSLSIAKGTWSYTGASMPTGMLVLVVIQGGRLYLNGVDTAAVSNFPANTDPLVFSGDCLISHFCAYNATLTAAQMEYIRQQGGLLPSSTHAACVAHYPCTHREGDKLYDVVEQYNYAKSPYGYIKSSVPISGDGFFEYAAKTDSSDDYFFISLESELNEIGTKPNGAWQFTSISDYVRFHRNGASLTPAFYFGNNDVLRVRRIGTTLYFQRNGVTQTTVAGVSGNLYPSIHIFNANMINLELARFSSSHSLTFSSGTLFIKDGTISAKASPYHAQLVNYSAGQHTGEAQSAWKDFYTKQDLRPYVDSNSDGTPDSPLVEEKSGLPPLQNALQFATGKEMQCGNVGSIQGIRFAVKQGAANQPLLTLDNTANTNVSVNAGTLTTGAGITNLQIYVDGVAHNATDAGAILNDLALHDVVLLFDAVSATDMRITAADKHLAALFVMSAKINRKQIIKLANNTLFSQPATREQDNISNFYNLNEIIDNAGTYEISNELGASNATLSGYTAAEIDPNDPSYVLSDINDLR